MSEGLIGAASMRTTTSFAPGDNASTVASDTSSSALFLIRDLSWKPETRKGDAISYFSISEANLGPALRIHSQALPDSDGELEKPAVVTPDIVLSYARCATKMPR
jgi:hypothetical protein